MVTRTEYLRGLLQQTLGSCQTIENMDDRPGDIAAMRVELLRAKGTMQVIVNKIDPHDYPNVDMSGLISRASSFLDGYYFEREMDIMEPLYGDDPGRIRHLRLKIVEALHNKSLTEKMNEVLEEI